MNLLQAKTQLEKIIALYKSMSADEKNISAIERDLMLGYIRRLYENFLDSAPAPIAASSHEYRPTTAAKPIETPPPPPPVVEKPRVETPPIETPPPPPVVVEKHKPEPTPPPVEQPRHQVPPHVPVESSKSTKSDASSDIEALFEAVSGKELSDKLANTPINDLAKAFGLNDRLLMQNELFGNNKAVFDEIIKDLNNASSFDSAKGYLVSFANRYNWVANSERQRHAKAFIKLVRRRFM